MMISSVFFDLDGTLADTAPDLAAALNKILQEQDKPALSLDNPLRLLFHQHLDLFCEA